MRPMSMVRTVATAAIAAVVVSWGGPAAFADIITNNVDGSVDAAAESITLTAVGASGSTTMSVIPTGDDGKSGCNLTGSTTLVTSVTSSDSGVATVSPSSLTFDSCGATRTVSVTAVASGTTTISLAQTSNNTGGTFDLAPATFTVTVTAKTATTTTVTCTPTSLTYTGSAQTPCTATTTGSGGFSQSTPVSYTANTNAGTATATATFDATTTRLGSSDTKTFTITKAPSTTTVSCPASVAWTGAPRTPCTALATGAGGLSQAVTPTYTDNTAVGTASASASYAGDANHNSSNGSGTFAIGKASSTTTITCGAGPFTYNGSAQTPCTARVTGAGGLDQAVPVVHTENTHAGTASASATWPGDATHEASSTSTTFAIGQAAATCSVTPYSGTYDGNAHGLGGSCVGLGGQAITGLDLGATHTNAGTHTVAWSFEGGTDYADQNGTSTVTIARATPDCTVVGFSGPFDGAAHGATGSCKGVENETLSGLSLGASFTNVPGGTASWSLPQSTNYSAASGTAAIVITKATPICDIAGFDGPYDATAHGATGSCEGVDGSDLDGLLLGSTFTDVPGGTAYWSLPESANHTGAASSVAIDLSPVAATCTVTGYDGAYTATAHGATGSCTGIDGESPGDLDLGDSFTDVPGGLAHWTLTGNDNYLDDADDVAITIGKAGSAVNVVCDPTSVQYTSLAQKPCSATATGVGLAPVPLTVDYQNNTSAGSASASATWAGDGNHQGSSGSSGFTITRAPSVTEIVCAEGPFTFDGNPHTPCYATVSGIGGLSITMGAEHTHNVDAGTASVSAEYAGDPNHEGSSDTGTFVIDKATSDVTVSCPPEAVYNGSELEPCIAGVTGAGGLDEELTPTYSGNVVVGTATAHATFAGDDNHTGDSDSATFEVTKATTTTTVTCPEGPYVYTGDPITPACSALATGAGGLSESVTPVTFETNTNAGTARANATYAGDDNHTGSSGSTPFTIDKAGSAVTLICPATVTYTGGAIEPCSATATGAGMAPVTLAVSYSDNVDTGLVTASASWAGDPNHDGSNGSTSFTITKAPTTTVVTCPASTTYTGAAQEICSAQVTGAGGLDESVAVDYVDNTDAGTATASAAYAGDANREASSGTETFIIDKASSTTVVTCPTNVTYDGDAQEPCTATVTGAGGLNQPVGVTYADNTDAGEATASATYGGDANHTGSSDEQTFTIDQAPSATTVTCTGGPFVFTGSAFTPCSASVTGAGGLDQSLTVAYTDNTNAGTATASASYDGDANHTGSNDSETFSIGKASSSVGFTCPDSVTYTGAAQEPCSASVTGAGGLDQILTVAYTNNTNAGTANASASYGGDANHSGSSGSDTFVIDPAASATQVTCPAHVTYDGDPQEPCTAAVTGAGGLATTATVTYSDNTDAGTATASAVYTGDANHTGSSGSKTFTIDKASSTTTVTCEAGPFTYTGSAQTPCTAGVTGAGGLSKVLTVDYAGNTDAGTATASAAYAGDANHTGSSGSKTFTIDKASSSTTVSCEAGPFTYTGSPQTPCTAGVTGAGGLSQTLTVTYGANTNAGTATASASYPGDANHTGSDDSKTFTIDKAASSVSLVCDVSRTYTGSPIEACSAQALRVGPNPPVSLTVAYTHNTNAGSAGASASYDGDANHEGSSATSGFTIVKAGSTTTVSCPATVTYTGSPQTPCTAVATGAGGLNQPLTVTHGSNTNAGAATAAAAYPGGDNHTGSGDSATFQITPAATTTTVTCPATVTYTGAALTPCTGKVTGPGGLEQALTVTYADNTNAGTATASASYAGASNYQASSGSKAFTIGKAASTVTVTCPAGPYYYTGSAITPTCTARVVGAGGLDLPVTPVTLSDNVAVGTAKATATYPGDDNHVAHTGTTTFTIGAWRAGGFYQPVDMGGVWNTVKAGSTVPLKFELFSGATELTSTTSVKSFSAGSISCATLPSSSEDPIELTTTGGTTLRYDTSGGQFIQNWQTPKTVGGCYKVTMTAADSTTVITAYFKLK